MSFRSFVAVLVAVLVVASFLWRPSSRPDDTAPPPPDTIGVEVQERPAEGPTDASAAEEGDPPAPPAEVAPERALALVRTVRGIVRDDLGNPVAAARVLAVRAEDFSRGWSLGRTRGTSRSSSDRPPERSRSVG